MEDTKKDLVVLKEILYDTILASSEQELEKLNNGDGSSIDQKLGVNVSSAMKKQGINVFQIANIDNKRINNNVVTALKIVDKIQNNTSLHLDSIDSSTVREVIKWLMTQNLTLDQFIFGMKRVYIEEVLKNTINHYEAAKKLGIKRAYLSKLKNRLRIGHEEEIESPSEPPIDIDKEEE